MTDTSTCPGWCTAGTADHPCNGEHLHLDNERSVAASGSAFPTIDERGAIFPAVGAGLNWSPHEGRGLHLHLWVTGAQVDAAGDLSLDFPLNDAFTLAVQILEMYAKAIQETDQPSAPHEYAALTPIVETIEHNLAWGDRDMARVESRIDDLKARLADIGYKADPEAYDMLFGRLIEIEDHRRELLNQGADRGQG